MNWILRYIKTTFTFLLFSKKSFYWSNLSEIQSIFGSRQCLVVNEPENALLRMLRNVTVVLECMHTPTLPSITSSNLHETNIQDAVNLHKIIRHTPEISNHHCMGSAVVPYISRKHDTHTHVHMHARMYPHTRTHTHTSNSLR